VGVYATTTSISELLPQYLSGNTTTSDTAGVNIFSRHVDRAEGIINSYVAARYSLPFTTTAVPVILRAIAEDIAGWMSIRGTMLQNSPLGREREQAFDRAWENLKDIQKGELKLTLTDGSEIATRTARFLTSTDYTPIIHLDDPINWSIDIDQARDIAADR